MTDGLSDKMVMTAIGEHRAHLFLEKYCNFCRIVLGHTAEKIIRVELRNRLDSAYFQKLIQNRSWYSFEGHFSLMLEFFLHCLPLS